MSALRNNPAYFQKEEEESSGSSGSSGSYSMSVVKQSSENGSIRSGNSVRGGGPGAGK